MTFALDHPWAVALGWALVHSLWQGALLGGFAWLALRALRGRRPQLRYLAGCLGLLLMLAAPVATFALLAWEPAGPAHHAGLGSGITLVMDPSAPVLSEGLRPWLPWVLQAWVAGVLVMALRLAGGWIWIQRLRWRSAEDPGEAWRTRLAELVRRLGVGRAVRLVRSGAVQVPLVLGWLRPVIVVPAAAFAGMDPRALEAVLAHELAHIRRHDYLVNLVQSCLEALLFYHPAVWWLSAQVRAEREHCCDDAAVAHCGDRIAYARALASLEALRQTPAPNPKLAPAATGGTLMSRIRRLLIPALPPSPAARTGLVAALAVSALGAATGLSLAPQAPPVPPEPPKVEAKQERQIVAVVTPERGAKGGRLTVKLKGKVKIQPDAEPEVLLEEDGASLDLEGRDDGKARRYRAERQGGAETRSWWLEGQPLPEPDAAAQAWLQRHLKELKGLPAMDRLEGLKGLKTIDFKGLEGADSKAFVWADGMPGLPAEGLAEKAKAVEAKAQALAEARKAGRSAELGRLEAELAREARELSAEARKLAANRLRFRTDLRRLEGGKDGRDREVFVFRGRPDGPEALKGEPGLKERRIVIQRKDGEEVRVVGASRDPQAEIEALKQAVERLQKRIDALQKDVATAK